MRINPRTGQPEWLPGDTRAPLYFDYDHQVWVKDGVYQDCAHPLPMICHCYGRLHAGERVPATPRNDLKLGKATDVGSW